MVERYRWDGEQLTLNELDTVAANLTKLAPSSSGKFIHTMNVAIIRCFLGDDWYKKYASLDADPASFVFPEFDANNRAPRYSILILTLAEILYNLQDVPGFASVLDNLSLNQIQSGIAELQVGALLKQRGVPFQYVDPKADPDRSFDLELWLPDGTAGRGEVKCKYERTPYTSATLKNAFGDARKQIGKGNSGVVFVKVPQDWVEVSRVHILERPDIRLPQEIIDVTKAEMRQSSRIKKVVFYVFHMAYDAELGVGVTNVTMEMTNARNGPESAWNPELMSGPKDGPWTSIPNLLERWQRNERNENP